MWKYVGTKECNNFLLSLKLFNCEDDKRYLKTLYSLSNNIEKNYHLFKIKKHNGKVRHIYEPKPLLKHIQRNILKNILNNKEISNYAKAYHDGVSLTDNAYPHLKKRLILKLDIKDFFENISFMNVYKSCFGLEYFPKPVGMLLTYLCTFQEYLPQGAPTSAYISNLVMKDFDEVVGKWCFKNNISYTRYSDDMTFSGDFNPHEVITLVKKELAKLNLNLNYEKIHVIKSSSNQSVTGITVNEKLQVNKKYRLKLRQEIYYIKKYGIDSHMERCHIVSKDTYLKSLYGKVLFVLNINPYDQEFQEYKSFLKNII